MSKFCEVVLSYISSTSHVWIYLLSFLLAATSVFLGIATYEQRKIYKMLLTTSWVNNTYYQAALCIILLLEVVITVILVICDKKKFIKRYLTAMYVLNMVAIAAFLILLPKVHEVKNEAQSILFRAMKSYDNYAPRQFGMVPPGTQYTNNVSTVLWNDLQNNYKCCGIEGENDWLLHNYNMQKKYYPKSCCSPLFMDETYQLCKDVESSRKKNGCMKPIKTYHFISFAALLVAMLLSFLLAAVAYIQGIHYEGYEK